MCFVASMHRSKDSLSDKQIRKFLNNAVSQAGVNNDGYGILDSNGQIIKKIQQFTKMEIPDLLKRLKNIKWLILHLRLATSGKIQYQNTHPIRKNGLVVIHNGIFGRGIKNKSDTLLFAEAIDKNDIEGSVTDYINQLSNPSYNVFIYFKDKLKFLSNKENYQFIEIDDTIYSANDREWLNEFKILDSTEWRIQPARFLNPVKNSLYDIPAGTSKNLSIIDRYTIYSSDYRWGRHDGHYNL